ncbi:uncharacterized protein LOC133914270 [Phragmites australis]|uniref:uncharacterized protein LOC133914270 n=1 Tax=Phragmites australis TaxID=29695 RepID=UPI002D784A6F|nr:uncharacterized protein LOC133914270 [Phragmites australis]
MFCECGTGSFKHVDEDPEALGCGGGGSPKARRKHGGKVNPYAERGLDRFSTVLNELESRRAKILRRVGSDSGLVMVRFVQSNGRWAPVVVKLPEEQLKGAAAKKPREASAAPVLPAASASPPSNPAIRQGANNTAKAPARRASFSWGRMRRPSRYWPAVIMLTLVSLAVFGRVFAICCTSIWWYLVPTLSSGCSDGSSEDAHRAGLRRSMEKKNLVLPPPHAKKGSSCGVHEVISSPRSQAKGKRG